MIQVNARWGGRGGGGRGGSRGGSRGGGRGQAGTGRGGSFGRAGTYGGSRGSSRGGSRGHLGKGVYSTTSYGTVGRPGAPGSYNTSTIRGANGRHISTSRAYGLARADGGFGQVGTGRGSFRTSARRGSFGNRGGGGVSRQTAAVAPLLEEMMVEMIHLRHHPEVVGNAACVSVTHPLAALPLVVVVEHKVHAALYASVDPLVDSVVVNPVVV